MASKDEAGMLGIGKNSTKSSCVGVFMMVPWPAYASIECPRPAQQLATDTSIKVQSAVSSLPSAATPPRFDASAETVTRDVFATYQDADKVVLAHSMLSMFCQFIFTSSFSDAQKLDQLDRLEEWVTRISGVTVPMNSSSGTSCSDDPAEVLKPIRATFDAWSRLDISEYMDQWAPDAIQRSSSKSYARARPDIETRRSADFKKYSLVSVQGINPKILFSDGTKARVTNMYSMRYVRLGGKVINETGIGESYILECSAGDHKWKIRENNDYLPHS
ncbi:MAG: hypothetical protein WBW81_02380 [Methylocella sp.]